MIYLLFCDYTSVGAILPSPGDSSELLISDYRAGFGRDWDSPLVPRRVLTEDELPSR